MLSCFNNKFSIITARKRSLGQGNVFTPVCQSVQGKWGSAQPIPPLDADPLPIRSTSGRYTSYLNEYMVSFISLNLSQRGY